MELQHIELSKLKLSPTNVRKHGAGDDLAELIASIKSLGVIQPLLVRSNCDGFEVVAGQRRLLACQAIAEETGKAELVPCGILQAGDKDRKSTRLNSSHSQISYAVFCLKK